MSFCASVRLKRPPLGGIGCLGYSLTYHTIIIIVFGKKPLLPWQDLKYGFFDIGISVVSMILGVLLSAFKISACRNSWPLF
jgi:hypothetical protein